MPLMLDDTIAAVASPPGAGARGIVRISGPAAIDCLRPVFRPADGRAPSTIDRAEAVPGSFCLPGVSSPLPGEAYLWPQGRSYTGQPVVEIHTLGSPPLLQALLRAVCAGGARLAGPGEFTLRAFLAGRIDLTQAEAVAGVIDAADADQLATALAQLAGGLTRPLARLRGELLQLLAELEAGLDFPDEDLPFLVRQDLLTSLAAAAEHVALVQAQMRSRSASGESFRVVLTGAANVGKSSLFNALTGCRALVSELPGTTRDYLVARLDLKGLACQIIDTAGHGDTAGNAAELELAAAAVADDQCRRADLRLLCLDASRDLTPAERRLLAERDDRRIVVLTKTDAAGPRPADLPAEAVATSSLTGAGMDSLGQAIRLALLADARGGAVAGTADRCRQSLQIAAESLERALGLCESAQGEELIAAEIRTALEEIGRVTGEVYTEDVLEVVFSRFCIGK